MFACQICDVERETAERLALQVHGPDAIRELPCLVAGCQLGLYRSRRALNKVS